MGKIPRVLEEVYGDRVQTLRQLILQLLAPALSHAPCECGGPVEEHFIFCARCDPSGYLLRDNDHAEYWKLLECSYGVVSNMAPSTQLFMLENRWTQRQIIERAIELCFRQATRPCNVICFGYQQPWPNHSDSASTSSPYAIERASSNSAIMLLNSEAWTILLSRVGDMFMLHLLLYTSIFYPIPSSSYLQICGVPVSSLVSSCQPDELVQIRPENHDATEICKASGIKTEVAWSHVKNQSQLEDLSHEPVQLTEGAKVPSICALNMSDKMKKKRPFTRSTGLCFNFSNTTRNRSGKYSSGRSCMGLQKRPFTSEHWTAGCKKLKPNIDRIPLDSKEYLVNSSTVCASGDYSNVCYSSKVAAWDFHHAGDISRNIRTLSTSSKEHTEMESVGLPRSYFYLNKKCPVHLWSGSKSDFTHNQHRHLECLEKTETEPSCSKSENISLEIHHSSGVNVAEKGGRRKRPSRLFSWQRRKIYNSQERSLSTQNIEHNNRLTESTTEGNSRIQELHSISDFFSPLENHGNVKRQGIRSQCVAFSKKLLKEHNIVRKTVDKALGSDQIFPLGSDMLSLDGRADNDQNADVLQQNKEYKLSSSKDEHVRQNGNVDSICSSSCCQSLGNRMVSSNQDLCAIHDHASYLKSDTLYPNYRRKKYFMTGRNCMLGACNTRAQKDDKTYEMQMQCDQKKQQMYSFGKSHVSEIFISKLIAKAENPLDFEENVKPKHQGKLISNARKLSCRCLCWLMLHTRHVDITNTLINRRCIFYNSSFSYHGGFPLNYILNVVKPKISGSKQLLAIIFGLPISCLHENISARTGGCESLCQNWSLLSMLKDLISNAQHCQYAELLTRHCPDPIEQANEVSMPSSKITDHVFSMEGYETQDKETLSIPHGTTDKDYSDEEYHATGSFPKHSCMHSRSVKRKREDHCNSEIDDGWNSKYSNIPVDSNEELIIGLQNEHIKSYSSHKEVVSFIWAVCRRIIPEPLLGSKCNWRALRSNLGKFVRLRRFENFTLQQCMYKLKTSHFPWLNGATLACQCYACLNNLSDRYPGYFNDHAENNERLTHHCITDTNKGRRCSQKTLLQENILANWIFWLFSSLIVPLIRAHFYVTETEKGRQNVFYYRKNVWIKILNGAVNDLTIKNYESLSAASLATILQKRSLGFSRVRILPKANGVRPIANLGAPSATWLQLHMDTEKPAKQRKTNRSANNMLILDRNNRGKSWKQMDFIEKNMYVSIDDLLIKGNQDAEVEHKCGSSTSDQLISDKSKKGKLNFNGFDSKVKLAFKSVNSLLSDVHHCLKFEQENRPESLGCSVFDYNDIYLKLMPFVLGLKDYSMGLPRLYIAVCDVAQAFDTVDQDKLLGMIQNIVQEQYFVQRYTKVSCTVKSVKVSYERRPVPEKSARFDIFSTKYPAKHSQSIFIDQAFCKSIKKDELLGLMYEHVKRNILQIGPHFYIQKVGIPQGSVLSSLLCSFYYGSLDRNRILPLLGLTQKQHIIVSPKTTFMDCLVNGNLSSSKLCNKHSLIEVDTICFKKMYKISSITARHSRSRRIEQWKLNASLNGYAFNAPSHCSSDNINEDKLRNSDSVLPNSMLLRLIDDLLFISTSKEKVISFIASMHMGFKDYNCYAKKCKTSLNFEMELEGEKLVKNVYKSKDGSCFLRWSGLLINCHTLEIQADYTRYCVSHISSTLSVRRQRNPGYHLMVKLRQFMRPKCHPIFYDSNINSPRTVRLNAYQAFLLCAMKFHAYVCSVPSVGAFSPSYAFQTIMKSTRYMYKLMKQRIHNIGVKASIRPIFSLHQKEIEWLGLYAYKKALQKKQSRYRQLLSFVEAKLHSSKYQDLVESADLHSAVDDCRSSMFWQIKY